ncbi:MAG: PAS domain-containing sensor histidine kinase [Candidatus Thorarchaeota archaeon]|nr:PAS domain-containing sensor histidine kinase [Candidatus Thorarchaeota archaeon]
MKDLEAVTNSTISQEEEASRYRALVDSMNDGFGIINREGVFTYVNSRFTKMLGYSEEEMVGKKILDFVDDKNKKIIRDNIRHRQEGESTQYEVEWKKSSGDPLPAIVSGAPMFDEDGNHRGSFAVITDISELRASQMALEENAEMMRQIFDESQIGIELFDANGILVAANRAALKQGGIKELKDLLGFSLFDDPNVPNEIKAKLIRGEPVKYETTFDFEKVKAEGLYETTRSGQIILDAWITPLGIENGGEIKGYLSQLLEITEEKQTEAALEDSEKRYQLVAENVTDVIFTSDLELNVTYVSPSAEHLLGYMAKELEGVSLIELMAPASVWTAIEAVKEALELEKVSDQTKTRGDAPPLEIQLKRKDGSMVWTEVARTFTRDEKGKPTGVLGVARNIEERREARKALVESEAKYRTLIDHSLQGFLIIQTAPLQIRFSNPAFATYLERSVDELLTLTPKEILDLIHPDDRDLILNRLQDLMKGAPPNRIPTIIRVFQKDGDMQWLEVFGRRIEFEETPAIQVVAMNITDRYDAEKHIETQKERALHLIDLMAHDFRNQLQIILGSTMVMELKLQDPEARRLLGQIVSSVERCQSMISKVKVTEPLMSVPLRIRKLDTAIDSVIESQKSQHRDVSFEISLDADNSLVEADQFLEQLLENIIENAIEHNHSDERIVWISLKESGDGYEISIGDNGQGISSSLKTAIFDVSRRYGGVGLNQSKQICDKYSGRIDVRDRIAGQPTKGAEFIVWLPKAREQKNSS